MSETAHTPGPWLWNGDRLECVGGAVIEHDSYEGMWFARYDAAEDAANKALIASAPDLLEALEPFADAAETASKVADIHGENEFVLSFGPVPVGVIPLSAFIAARAALSKASANSIEEDVK